MYIGIPLHLYQVHILITLPHAWRGTKMNLLALAVVQVVKPEIFRHQKAKIGVRVSVEVFLEK